MLSIVHNAQLLNVKIETKTFNDTTYDVRTADILVMDKEHGNFFEQFLVGPDKIAYFQGLMSSNDVITGFAVIDITKRKNGGFSVVLVDFVNDKNTK